MKLGKYIYTLILAAVVADAAAQQPITLKECIERGLENNFSLRMVRNKEQMAKNDASWANAGLLPSLDLSAGYSGTFNSGATTARDGSQSSYCNVNDNVLRAGVDLQWTIFDGFKAYANYDRLRELKLQSSTQTRIAVEDYIAAFTSEYYNYIQQQIRLKNFKYAVALSKERLRVVEQRYRIGNFSGLDYQQAKVDFNSDSSAFMKQQEALQSSAIALNELLARENLNVPIAVADTAIEVAGELVFDDLMGDMMENNTSLLRARMDNRIAVLDYKIKASQAYPYLRLNAGYGYTLNKYNKGANYHRATLGADFGVTLGINIFDGNNARRERHNARINIENAQLEQTDVGQALNSYLYNIWQAYRNNLQVLELEKENLVTAKLNHEIAMERYMLGDLSGIEMREAQKSLLDAEERLLSASYNTKLCEISLLQISGRVQEYLQ